MARDAFRTMEYLHGINPVRAALRFRKLRRPSALFVQDHVGRKSSQNASSSKNELVALAKKHRIAVKLVPKKRLASLVGQHAHHQGVALEVSPLPSVPAVPDPFVCPRSHLPLVLALDSITDPHNVGAVLRSASFFGAAGVILSKSCARLSPVVSKASAGALERFAAEGRLFGATSLRATLRSARDAGWLAVGAHSGDGAHDGVEAAIKAASGHSAASPVLLALGAEHRGLSTRLRSELSLVRIRGGEDEDSLNVSCAAAVLLGDFARIKGEYCDA